MIELFSSFQKKSLKEKLLYTCIVITLIPMVIIAYLFFIQAKNTAYDRQIERTSAYADQLIQNYTFEIEKAELMATSLAEFVPLETYLYTKFDSNQQALKYYEATIHPMIAGYNNSRSGTRVRIYHNQNLPNFSVELNNHLDSFVETFFEQNPFLRSSSFWVHLDCYPLQSALCYFRPVANQFSPDPAYVVSIQLKEKVFYSYIENEPTENNLIFLMDKSGYILTSNDRQYSCKMLSELGPSLIELNQLNDNSRVLIDNEEFLVINRSSNELHLSILISDTSLQKELIHSTLVILLIGAILILLSAVMIILTTQKSLAGVDALMLKMNKVNRMQIHRMAKTITDETNHDEISQLDTAFTKMMQQIDELMDKIKSDELQLKDEIIARQQAELSYLQQQINPHYLFNTLETIRMNLVIKNDYETANIIKIFASSIRRYIDIREQYSSLYEEMMFVEKYIFIQNYRTENKIDYRLEASNSVLKYHILKLLIQPIIENSVIHGFESKTTGKQIRVSITRQNALLYIKISDNGCGIDSKTLSALQEYICSTDSPSDSVGLRNVFMRTKLAYGDASNLILDSVENVGTDVILVIPISNDEAVNENYV